jgi:hypothetical protein
VGGQHHASAALPPGQTRHPLYRRLGGPQGRCGRVRKISPPTGIRSPDRSARSQSLYRLSYPAHTWRVDKAIIPPLNKTVLQSTTEQDPVPVRHLQFSQLIFLLSNLLLQFTPIPHKLQTETRHVAIVHTWSCSVVTLDLSHPI